MVKPRGLGRGLDALLGGEAEPERNDRLMDLAVGELRPGRYQPRTQIDPESIVELADSIRAQGVIQPILVRPLPAGGYEIIAGERRWRAAMAAGLDKVPALVRTVADDHALAIALIENIQREGLNPIEEAQGIQRLISEFAMTHEQAAEAVGRSRSAVTNLLRLLQLARPVQEMVLGGRLDMGHARALLPLSAAQQIEAAHSIVLRQLSVREAERLARSALQPPRTRPPVRQDQDVRRLAEELSDRLGLSIAIQASKTGSGKLVIGYSSLDQLDAVLARLKA